MSDDEDETENGADAPADGEAEPEPDAGALSPDDLGTRLDDAADALDAAATEADLDEVEASLEDIEADLDAADLPEEPDEDDGDEESPAERLSGRLEELRSELQTQRGPYVEDVVETVESAAGELRDTRWTEDGATDAVAAARTFADAAAGAVSAVEADLGIDASGTGEDAKEVPNTGAAADGLERVAGTLSGTDLDPDEDTETIAALVEAAETLAESVEDAETWADLTVREQLDAQGFYDVLNPENRKDFPAEWNAIKIYEQGREPEPILNALDRFESDFMEENILNALEHFAPEAAFDAMHERAQRRSHQPIRILGRIGDERACETLHEFLGGGDVKLETVTLRALGAIGSEESTQPVANRLVADDREIRSLAARALGLIGDTRAIEPLGRVLESDEADEVRASAAWALNRIGTERARSVAAEYADDRSYIVQTEAERAAGH